jgi:hypothetical protein
MGSKFKPLMVPWDFTKVAEYALEHAVKISKIDGNACISGTYCQEERMKKINLKGIMEILRC